MAIGFQIEPVDAVRWLRADEFKPACLRLTVTYSRLRAKLVMFILSLRLCGASRSS